jgi:hypothetical protein
MQLADHVERKCNGQSATEAAPAHPVLCSRHLASHCRVVSTSHVSPLCESTHPTVLAEFSTAFKMTPNWQQQPCLSNNAQAFTQCCTQTTK